MLQSKPIIGRCACECVRLERPVHVGFCLDIKRRISFCRCSHLFGRVCAFALSQGQECAATGTACRQRLTMSTPVFPAAAAGSLRDDLDSWPLGSSRPSLRTRCGSLRGGVSHMSARSQRLSRTGRVNIGLERFCSPRQDRELVHSSGIMGPVVSLLLSSMSRTRQVLVVRMICAMLLRFLDSHRVAHVADGRAYRQSTPECRGEFTKISFQAAGTASVQGAAKDLLAIRYERPLFSMHSR